MPGVSLGSPAGPRKSITFLTFWQAWAHQGLDLEARCLFRITSWPQEVDNTFAPVPVGLHRAKWRADLLRGKVLVERDVGTLHAASNGRCGVNLPCPR